MTKYTPGSWAADVDAPKTRNAMAMVVTSGGGRAIDCTGSGRNRAEDRANAFLVAAAPELLAAAKAAVKKARTTAPCPGWPWDGDPTIQALLAAIAKAEGGAQ